MGTELNYLVFDYSDNTEGLGHFVAMASVTPERVAALRAEIALVLDWAFDAFPHSHGPFEDGGEWDHDLQGRLEFSAEESLSYDPVARAFTVHVGPAGVARHAVTFSIGGVPEFCGAFARRFGVE
ncbi:MAG: hypothetical protein RLZZ618_3948 [Pseudomonadota bacterium]|jgi:hypothetical protein